MQKLITSDGEVAKYIHDDGSETAIKFNKTIKQTLNSDKNNFKSETINREKYTIFISTSKGCFMSCKFCHLTMKECSFKKLSPEQVTDNIKKALQDTFKQNPELKNYYVKLSWMGMGEAFIEPEKVKTVSLNLLHWIFERDFAKGLDGVDLATVYPKINNLKWVNQFNSLNNSLKQFPQNPNNFISEQKDKALSQLNTYKDRTPFRLFYSIHTAIQENRDKLIPNANPLNKTLPILVENCTEFNLIFHHMFLNGINDSDKEIKALIALIQNYIQKKELRVLRYNECSSGFFFFESKQFLDIIKKISEHTQNLKVQISPGSEIKAACGQFIVDEFNNIKK